MTPKDHYENRNDGFKPNEDVFEELVVEKMNEIGEVIEITYSIGLN